MPTENRSSNTEMVSVPRHWAQETVNAGPGECVSRSDIALLSEALSQPVQQHQGLPVALAVPEECPHIIVFDDADRANEHFCGTGAKPAALRRFEQISRSWNAHLFVRIARNSRDDRYPSAMVADSAEVERLRNEHTEAVNCGMRYQDQCKALRAQLAEAQALLNQLFVDLQGQYPSARIHKALSVLKKNHGASASAGPRAPVMQIPEGYCVMPQRLTAENGAKALLLGEFKLKTTHECPECAELEEPAEGCEICDGAGEYEQPHTIPWDQIKLIYSEAVKGLALKQ